MLQINDPRAVAEVTSAFERYERAIVENDWRTLNDLFWDCHLTLRYGYREILYGYKAIEEFRSSRQPATGTKTILNCVVTTYGEEFATVNIDFLRAPRHGRQSQTWVRLAEGWRIVAAHVSYLEGS